ncbi:hypothetical protein B7494_g6685 [Chlorociboria aeruginascens]|nr:hypothetical protein B7494_g6685 [Chlorociboria aeruginascens]
MGKSAGERENGGERTLARLDGRVVALGGGDDGASSTIIRPEWFVKSPAGLRTRRCPVKPSTSVFCNVVRSSADGATISIRIPVVSAKLWDPGECKTDRFPRALRDVLDSTDPPYDSPHHSARTENKIACVVALPIAAETPTGLGTKGILGEIVGFKVWGSSGKVKSTLMLFLAVSSDVAPLRGVDRLDRVSPRDDERLTDQLAEIARGGDRRQAGRS